MTTDAQSKAINDIYLLFKDGIIKTDEHKDALIGFVLSKPESTEAELDQLIKENMIFYEPKQLRDLQASDAGKHVQIDCQIVGEKAQKAVIRSAKYLCPSCAAVHAIGYTYQKSIRMKKLEGPEECCCGRKGKFQIQDVKHEDYAELFVRDVVHLDAEDAFRQSHYNSYRVHVIGKRLPKTKMVRLKGLVFVDENKDISVIATDIQEQESAIEDFKITEKDKADFTSLIKDKEIHQDISPDIILRETAKKALDLQLHSPAQIHDIEGKEIIRGCLNVAFIGDSKTAKSRIGKDVTQLGTYKLAEYFSAETSGRTGLLYAIDTEKDALIWGALPNNDKGMLVIDGLQKFSSDEQGQTREAIEQQLLIVQRLKKGSAMCRTRLLSCLNPYKSMDNYITRCEAIKDTSVFRNPPDVTRIDMFIPFCETDVDPDAISQRTTRERKVPIEVFKRHVLWAWSRKPKDIIFSDPAKAEIKKQAANLMRKYSIVSLPIVHSGCREVITRMSAATACMEHSTDESHERVIVEQAHVLKAVSFYEEVLGLLQLKAYKDDVEGKSVMDDAEYIKVMKELKPYHHEILEAIKRQSKSSGDLADKLGLSSRSVKDYYTQLKDLNLIETKTGRGAELSTRGVKFMRWMTINEKPATQKPEKKRLKDDDGETKLHQYSEEDLH